MGSGAVPLSANVAPPSANAAPNAAEPPSVSPADDSPIEAQLRQRYGSHMDVVKLGLDAWKAIGLLYAEWCEPWTRSTTEYAEMKALALLRCAIRLSQELKACSAGNHKSWYAFLGLPRDRWLGMGTSGHLVPRQSSSGMHD